MTQPVQIFIAYSRKDAAFLDKLRGHLKPLERTKKVNVWYDGLLELGAEWEDAIKKHLHSSDIILLLVSADAIASDYFYEKEVSDALERHRRGEARVVPIIIRPCAWETTPLADLQALPKNGKPVTSWSDRHKAFADVANALLAMVNNIEQKRQEQSAQASPQKEDAERNRQAAAFVKEKESRRPREAEAEAERAVQERLAREAEAQQAEYARRMAEAQKYLNRRNWPQAITAANTALLVKPGDASAQSLLQQAEEGNRELAPRKLSYLKWGGITAGVLLAVFLVVKLSGGSEKNDTYAQLEQALAQAMQDRKLKQVEDLRYQFTLLTQNEKVKEKLKAIDVWIMRYDTYAIQKLENDFVRVAGGSLTMGCFEGRDEPCRHDGSEEPIRIVHVPAFSMGRYEVTQAQWRAVMGSSPSKNKGCDECPVDNVSWNDIQEFLKKLNALTGKKYRLPTEAEWEFAARGGNQSKGYLYSGSNNLNDVAWYDDNSGVKTRPVGRKQPNELGLYDMSGNVWEWVQDCWHDNYNGAPTDGSAWVDANDGDCSSRVLRGGSWESPFDWCFRCAHRVRDDPAVLDLSLGFRLAQD